MLGVSKNNKKQAEKIEVNLDWDLYWVVELLLK
jgi:hypothetical protein